MDKIREELAEMITEQLTRSVKAFLGDLVIEEITGFYKRCLLDVHHLLPKPSIDLSHYSGLGGFKSLQDRRDDFRETKSSLYIRLLQCWPDVVKERILGNHWQHLNDYDGRKILEEMPNDADSVVCNRANAHGLSRIEMLILGPDLLVLLSGIGKVTADKMMTWAKMREYQDDREQNQTSKDQAGCHGSG